MRKEERPFMEMNSPLEFSKIGDLDDSLYFSRNLSLIIGQESDVAMVLPHLSDLNPRPDTRPNVESRIANMKMIPISTEEAVFISIVN
jgi:hypothetical protein